MQSLQNAAHRFALSTLLCLIVCGCTAGPFSNNPFGMQPGSQALQPPPSSSATAQTQGLQQRAAALDADNQLLTAQLAQKDAALLRAEREIADMRSTGAVAESGISRRGVPARAASHGGALPLVNVRGAEVFADGDVVRIRMESSQLFNSGKAELKPEVHETLDRIAQVLRSDYGGHLVGIEGHTDSDPITKSKWKNNHELSVARSVAVFEALKKRGVSESQLFVAGYGPNHPVTPSGSKQSKSRNRRVEIVVYPDSARS